MQTKGNRLEIAKTSYYSRRAEKAILDCTPEKIAALSSLNCVIKYPSVAWYSERFFEAFDNGKH